MFDKMLKQLENMLDSETINKMISEKQEEIKKLINRPISIKVVNKSDNLLPEYATEGSAGMDVRAFIKKSHGGLSNEHLEQWTSITLKPGERSLIPTGLYFELPEGYEMQVRPRSGLAIKNGITIVNAPGTLDSDYRGELKIILLNTSNEEFTINNGDRIAQIVIAKYQKAEFEVVEELGTTERGEGGFNSTGVK